MRLINGVLFPDAPKPKLKPEHVSYWQQGCDDAKAGLPARRIQGSQTGYDNGYYYGQHGIGKPNEYVFQPTKHVDGYWLDGPYNGVQERPGEFFTEDPDHGEPDPVENPYMQAIEHIERVMDELPTNGLDRAKREEYAVNLLEVRDTLHRFRQAEMGSTAG